MIVKCLSEIHYLITQNNSEILKIGPKKSRKKNETNTVCQNLSSFPISELLIADD